MIIRHAEVSGQIRDVRCDEGRVTEIAPALEARSGERVLEARAGALLPGLQDHHIHLHALAAALASVPCGPPSVSDAAALARRLRAAAPDRGWIRGSGYFESVAGPLDRERIDAMQGDSPVRIQHRSGAMWFLNSRAIEALELDRVQTFEPNEQADVSARPQDSPTEPPMIERDARGRATGRLFRADSWLRERLPPGPPPDLAPVGHLLAACGVTAVTDATPSNAAPEAMLFRAAQASGALPQRLSMMGALDAEVAALFDDGASIERAAHRVEHEIMLDANKITLDAHKIMLDEPALPDLEMLIGRLRRSHDQARPAALHTVTRAEIHFALAALESAAVLPGDRLEHASVAPPEAIEAVRRLGIRIVTQPNFIAERGDAYLNDVAPADLPHLYLVRSWLDAGVELAGGTDAPFGNPDPWRAMRAAVDRRTPSGARLGETECVSPETALELFLPGFARASVAAGMPAPSARIGAPADLCLLSLPWQKARLDLSCEHVVATLVAGEPIYRR